EHLTDDVVRRNELQLTVILLDEAPDALDHRAGTTIVGLDVVENRAQLSRVDSSVLQHALRGSGVREDGRQRLVDLVRQRRRQLAHDRNSPEVRELTPPPLLEP